MQLLIFVSKLTSNDFNASVKLYSNLNLCADIIKPIAYANTICKAKKPVFIVSYNIFF